MNKTPPKLPANKPPPIGEDSSEPTSDNLWLFSALSGLGLLLLIMLALFLLLRTDASGGAKSIAKTTPDAETAQDSNEESSTVEPEETANEEQDDSSEEANETENDNQVPESLTEDPEMQADVSEASSDAESPAESTNSSQPSEENMEELDELPRLNPDLPSGVIVGGFGKGRGSNPLDGNNEDFESLLKRLKKDGLDIVITFDSTGSMQGEIDQVKDQIERIGIVLFKLVPKTRISICTYRDYGDAYVVNGLPLTDNLKEIVLSLRQVQANGGGDEPEAVDDGLWLAIKKNDFRKRAKKVVLLFGDAPPRPSRMERCKDIVSDFRKAGGIVSTVTCRSPVPMKEFVSIAKTGQGEAFVAQDEQEIMSQLIVLVFGSQHQAKVVEAFDLMQRPLGH